MIGRLHHVVVDCPDPQPLAAFYAEPLVLQLGARRLSAADSDSRVYADPAVTPSA